MSIKTTPALFKKYRMNLAQTIRPDLQPFFHGSVVGVRNRF